MTLIIGIEDPENHRSILASDSGAWRNDQVDVLRTPKIWRSNGWIAGLSGRWSASLIARRMLMPTLVDPTREEAEQALASWAHEFHRAVAEQEDLNERVGSKRDNSGLVVCRGEWVWYVCDGCVTNVERGWQVVGAEDYAIGALAAFTSGFVDAIEPLELAHQVLLAVDSVTTAIHGPFRWMATDGTEGVWT